MEEKFKIKIDQFIKNWIQENVTSISDLNLYDTTDNNLESNDSSYYTISIHKNNVLLDFWIYKDGLKNPECSFKQDNLVIEYNCDISIINLIKNKIIK